MVTLLPQLVACGFFPRPLCIDDPSYLILLWPVDATWGQRFRGSGLLGNPARGTHARHGRTGACVGCAPPCAGDAVLPLQERVMVCLFGMLRTAHAALTATGSALPPLAQLLPDLDVQLCDL
jgi:hypothetical protein